MGVTQSKDDTNAIVRRSLKGRDILDEEGVRLKNEVDKCLSANMWWFTGAGVLMSIPAAVMYKTEKPLLAAAILSPLLDMAYATSKCANQRDAFLIHYNKLKQQWVESMAEDEADSKPLPPSEEVKISDVPASMRSSPPSRWPTQQPPDSRAAASRIPRKDDEWQQEESTSVTADEGIVFEDLPGEAPPKKRGWW